MSNTTESRVNIEHYKYIHDSDDGYGSGSRHFDYVQVVLRCCGFKNVLDFGCGKGALADQLTEAGVANCTKYDPARPGIDQLPDRLFEVVINTDVLEHVPEPDLPAVLTKFNGLADNAVIIPHLALAREILPNGENAHCTIKTPEEWHDVFSQHYNFVNRFHHDSDNHALFLCSQDELPTQSIEIALDVLHRHKLSPNEMRVCIDDGLAVRAKAAIKLLLGRSVRTLRQSMRNRPAGN